MSASSNVYNHRQLFAQTPLNLIQVLFNLRLTYNYSNITNVHGPETHHLSDFSDLKVARSKLSPIGTLFAIIAFLLGRLQWIAQQRLGVKRNTDAACPKSCT